MKSCVRVLVIVNEPVRLLPTAGIGLGADLLAGTQSGSSENISLIEDNVLIDELVGRSRGNRKSERLRTAPARSVHGRRGQSSSQRVDQLDLGPVGRCGPAIGNRDSVRAGLPLGEAGRRMVHGNGQVRR